MIVWIVAAVASIAILSLVGALRSHRELRRWLGRDRRGVRRYLAVIAWIVAATCIGRALAIAALEPPELAGAGADVVLAVDVSRSMDTEDTAPSRLRRALRTAERVVGAGAGVRLALVLFAGDAYVALPLTQDADALLTYLRALDTEVISAPGTNLTRALDTSARVFDPESSRPRRVILLSDGEHDGPGLEEAIGRLRSLGIEVTAVGFGTEAGDYVPGPGNEPLRDDRGRPIESRRADHVLRRVAAATEGTYHREFEDAPGPERLLPDPSPLSEDPADEQRSSLFAWLAIAAALLVLELALSVEVERRGRLRPVRALGAALAALLALGVGPWGRLGEGDELLEAGEARRALSLYRAHERRNGASPETRLRIGNAQYRLDEPERAATRFQSALRDLKPDDHTLRFVASFNLGVTYLALERFGPARDEFWSALRERPDSLEAKFNYEWASERVPPEPDVPVPPTPQETEQPGDSGGGGGEQGEGGAAAGGPAEPSATLEQAEAERWLETLQEQPGDPLRREIAAELEGKPRPRGQTW